MADVLTDLSPSSLAGAVKRNLHESLQAMGRTSVGEFRQTDSLSRWAVPVGHPWFNGVLCATPPPPDADILILDALEYFKTRDVKSITWWTAPEVDPADWNNVLSSHGFFFSNDTPGMALDLEKLPSQPAPDGLSIAPVTDAATFDDWAHTFMVGYGLPLAWEKPYGTIMSEINRILPGASYLGNYEGQPVCASSLLSAAGAAGVYNVATLPEFRGRGFGEALTVYPLLEARQMGYRVAVLQSSELGYRIYQRLGFHEVCKLEYFVWQDKPPAD